ncbi:transporter substrate-binding domain-containing protein [Mangrovicoccus algicola]|uniref:Transporter substrate-binding domain-containing protein n=1 Tax=Mangrovicoccus algicola TaxID=2771008 RepID=A0A8J7CMK5_9RHOB|nr:transporter substrate-binding domain-containing protein [Mangrovicoccus algicola]MBE3640546.1 transporter substrate-binding domain-containing protein [Mangrovicoccus algicola]
MFRPLRLAAAFLAATAALPAMAQDSLVIGTEAAYRPFAWVLPSGELTGFDIDIARALCTEMGVTCEISDQAYDGLIPALNAGKVDAIIASMFITEDRLEAIDFAGPYYVTPGLFIGPEGADLDLTPESLKRKFIGVQRGSTMADYVEARLPGARVQFYDTLDAATLDLVSGRVDLVFADSVVIEEFLASEDGAGFAQVGEPVTDPILGEGAGIGLRKGEEELKARFDAALAAIIASGEYAEINARYMSSDIAPK